MTYGVPARARRRHFPDVVVHPGAHVERRDPDRIGIRKTETDERINNGERLDRLRRVEVIPFLLVDDVQARTDHGYALH